MSLWRKNTLGLSYLSGCRIRRANDILAEEDRSESSTSLQDHGSRSMYSRGQDTAGSGLCFLCVRLTQLWNDPETLLLLLCSRIVPPCSTLAWSRNVRTSPAVQISVSRLTGSYVVSASSLLHSASGVIRLYPQVWQDQEIFESSTSSHNFNMIPKLEGIFATFLSDD
jgi:hypothetical protein